MIPTRRAMSSIASRSLRSSLPRLASTRVVSPFSIRSAAVQSTVIRSSVLSSHRFFHATPLRLEAETINVPSMAESITEGTLKQWLKKEGDYVEADEEIATIETDKIDVAVNAPKAGYIRGLLAQEEDTVTVGQALFKLEAGDAPEGGAQSAKSEPQEQKNEKEEAKKEEPTEKKEEKKPEPKKEKKQDTPPPPPKATKSSPEQTSDRKPEPKKSSPAPKEKEEPKHEPRKATAPGSREETRVKMSRMRLRIAERLKQSQNSAAALTTFNEIDMSSLMAMRSAYKDGVLKNTGVKLGFMSAFAKAACLALKEIPAANASIEEDQIIYREYVDLSVAVATPKGLVTPVLRNAEGLDFIGIEQGISDLGKKARDNKLTLEDMAGGTFTISNGGVFGSMYGTPIINLPQAAVLGMHAIKDRAVVVDGQIVIRPIMIVALTYDHRLLDGREAVTFLVRIKEYIEDPRRMLLA